jgi:hypothetical protein
MSAAFPLTCIWLVCIAWIIAFAQLGHPPRYYVDDLKEIGLIGALLQGAIVLCALFWIPAVMASAVFYTIGVLSRILQREFSFGGIAIPPLLWASLFAFVNWNPLSVFTWLGD